MRGNRSGKGRWAGRVLGGAGFAFVCLSAWVVLVPHPAKLLPAGSVLQEPGESIRPESVQERSVLGPTRARDGRSFYVIRFAVRAGTQAAGFEAHQILVRSLDRGRLVRSYAGQQEMHGEGEPITVAPGQADERTLVFEGPVGVRHVGVLFSVYGGVGVWVKSLCGIGKQVVLPVCGEFGKLHQSSVPAVAQFPLSSFPG